MNIKHCIYKEINLMVGIFLLCLSNAIYAADKFFNIYLDADRSNHFESARAIELGLHAGFSRVNYQLQGREVRIVLKDHRGNVKRSKRHMEDFLKDPNALVLIGGLHSPPLIKYREFINKNELLTMVPWAAGGPITRYPSKDNWVFRVSVDDTKAGARMASFSSSKSCKNPMLLLEKTPWGKSNHNSLSKAFNAMNVPFDTVWFNWGIDLERAEDILLSASKDKHDCLLFVGNAVEGKVFFKAMQALKLQLPVISHWGITGGKFFTKVTEQGIDTSNLFFIQTCFDLIRSQSAEKDVALASIRKIFPVELQDVKNIKAPTGFIHAYDLVKILLQASAQVTLTNNMEENRAMLKNALENLKEPVQGILKNYQQPFTVFSGDNMDAHEAIGLEDLCMGQYGKEGDVVITFN